MPARSEFRLPLLSGWVLTGYRLLMVALLLIALPGFLYAYEQQRDAQAEAGATFAAGLRFPGGNATTIRIAPFSDEARAKGVLSGDVLLAIDGRSIPEFDFATIDHALTGPDGSQYRLTLQTEDQPPRTITLTRSAHYIDQAYAGSGLSFASRSWTVFGFRMLDAALAMLTALALFVRRTRDPVAAMLAISAVPLADGLTYLWADAGTILYAFSILRTMLFLLALLTFPDGRFAPRWAFWATPLIPVIGIVSVQSMTMEFALGLQQILLFGFLIFAIGALVLRYRATPPGTERQQIKVVLWGGVAWIILALVGLGLGKLSAISITVATAAWLSLASHLAGSLAAVALEVGILVSLLRYRLYDADTLIGRSAGYAFLTLLLGAVFSGSEKMVQVMGQQMFGEGARVVSAGFGAAIAATSIAPLNKRIHRWAEHRFQRQLAALKSDLPRLVGDLREVATLDSLLASVLERIERGVRAGRAAVILREEGEAVRLFCSNVADQAVLDWRRDWRPFYGKAIDCDRGDALFPVRLPLRAEGAGTIGWLLLGPRPDGSVYGKDEREALVAIADPIARAIQIVRERDARRAEQQAARVALEQRIASLEGQLQAIATNLAPR